MEQSVLELFKVLNPDTLQKQFLNALLKIQNVKRGSIWMKKQDAYVCVEAAGTEAETIKGVSVDANTPSIVGWVIENQQMTVAETQSDRRHYKELEETFAVKSSLILCFPLFFQEDQVYGAVQIIDTSPDKQMLNLEKSYLDELQNLVNICSTALRNAILYHNEKQKSHALEMDLKNAIERAKDKEIIIGQSRGFQHCMDLAKNYAKTDFHVLITGESGTGKELIAEKIHRSSSRSDKPFLIQNCSAIPETLLESELFGYKKGAFTGAVKDKTGLFEAADGGTVFLDEIGDMPMNIQASLLRVLQKNEIKLLGDTAIKHVDIRIVTATNKDIKEMITQNQFREDLFYRLSVLPVHLPPLRERPEDIPLLVKHFLEKECAGANMAIKAVTKEAMQALSTYTWPGNVRELENLIRYLMVITPKETIAVTDIPPHVLEQTSGIQPFDHFANTTNTIPDDFVDTLRTMTWPQLEKKYVTALLEKNNGNITWAAKAAGINRSTFASRMRKLKIKRFDN